eukprot:4292295-Amphidinium_carterae.4
MICSAVLQVAVVPLLVLVVGCVGLLLLVLVLRALQSDLGTAVDLVLAVSHRFLLHVNCCSRASSRRTTSRSSGNVIVCKVFCGGCIPAGGALGSRILHVLCQDSTESLQVAAFV